MDEIYVWEAREQPEDAYWEDATDDERRKWKPRLTFYNGIPVSAEPGHEDNIITQLNKRCHIDDFCSFKLDIDTPGQERLINNALLSSPSMMALVDEYFFEHHVRNNVMRRHGLGEVRNNKSVVNENNSLTSWYTMAIRARKLGLRTTVWGAAAGSAEGDPKSRTSWAGCWTP